MPRPKVLKMAATQDGFDGGSKGMESTCPFVRPCDSALNPILESLEIVSKESLNICAKGFPPTEQQIMDVAIAYIGQMEKDQLLLIDMLTGNVMKGLTSDEFEKMDGHFRIWLI